MRNSKIYLILLMGMFLAGIIRVHAETPHRVGLVVQHGDGSVQTQCITFPEDTISGLDVLQRSGFDLNVDAGNSMGATICRLDGEGCSFPQEDCFCQCTGSDCVYWSYWRQNNGGWVYSSSGASNTQVHDGDVEGWVWGQGTTGGAVSTPPNLTFADICAANTPTDTPIPPAPLPSPTPTDTPSPVPTPSPTATDTPLPPTDTPTPTPLPPTDTPTHVAPTATPTTNQSVVEMSPTPTNPLPTATQPPPTATPTATPTDTPTPTITPVPVLPTAVPILPTAPVAVARADVAATPTGVAPAPVVSQTNTDAVRAEASKRLVTFGALSILVILFTTVPVLLLAGAVIWWLVKK